MQELDQACNGAAMHHFLGFRTISILWYALKPELKMFMTAPYILGPCWTRFYMFVIIKSYFGRK